MNKRGQHLAEYAVLLTLVVGAYVGIQTYTSRACKARVRDASDALTSISAKVDSLNGGLSTTFASQSQYEPYYQRGLSNAYTENVKQEHMGGGAITEEIVSDMSARLSGSWQAQTGAEGRDEADAMWDE